MIAAILMMMLGAAVASPAQTFTNLLSFDGTDGLEPEGSLVQGADGNFYGVTDSGGTNNWGTVFKMTPSGTLTSLYNFCSQSGCADGSSPFAGLVLATDGNFYGTTGYGGTGSACRSGCGTIFEITPGGTLTTLHSFDSTDGANPVPTKYSIPLKTERVKGVERPDLTTPFAVLSSAMIAQCDWHLILFDCC